MEVNEQFIGISENMLHHIYGVAKKAYSIAKEVGYNEDFARKMFVLGWNHDIGYEFSQTQKEHPDVSSKMLISAFLEDTFWGAQTTASMGAILKHGRYTEDETPEWIILNMADMLIDSNGKEVSVSVRLDGIKERYGEHSDQYLTACDICYRIGLTAVNLAGLDT